MAKTTIRSAVKKVKKVVTREKKAAPCPPGPPPPPAPAQCPGTCPATPYGFEADVKPLFSARDRTCMINQLGLDLWDYCQVMAAASDIYSAVSPPDFYMPKGGPPWDETKLNTFCCWMQGGYQP